MSYDVVQQPAPAVFQVQQPAPAVFQVQQPVHAVFQGPAAELSFDSAPQLSFNSAPVVAAFDNSG